MTQETADGIPLRFKGLVIYRIVRPEATSRLFDFTSYEGLEQIQQMLSHLCLGELRACVAGMSMKACVEERKTTLTQTLGRVLRETVELTEDGDWGLQIEVVQVAQVYVTDPELRYQLEAEARDEIRSQSQLSALRADQKLQQARADSERVNLEQSLLLSRERARVQSEEQEFNLQMRRKQAEHEHQLRQEELERETPYQLRKVAAAAELAEERKKLAVVEGEAGQMEAEYELKIAKQKQDLRKEILALEQAPQIAESLAGMLNNAQLHFWGQEPTLLGPLAKVLNSLSEKMESR